MACAVKKALAVATGVWCVGGRMAVRLTTAEMMARTTKTRPTMVSMARPKMTMAMEMRMGMTGMWAQKMQAYG